MFEYTYDTKEAVVPFFAYKREKVVLRRWNRIHGWIIILVHVTLLSQSAYSQLTLPDDIAAEYSIIVALHLDVVAMCILTTVNVFWNIGAWKKFWKRINYLGGDWRCCQYKLPLLITVLETVNESLLTREVKGKQLKKVINFTKNFMTLYISSMILLIFLACFLNLLYIVGAKMLHADDDRIASTTWRLVTTVPVCYSLIAPLAITFCCDSTTNECRKIIEICFTLKQSSDYTPEDKEELQVLLEQFTVNPVKFTAAGFFEINRSNMLSFLSSIATYLIVFI
nr:unnamed protein product [Callosobruchus analis]